LASCCAAFISSGIDISDGLVGDLGHIIDASGVGATLQAELFPYSAAANCCMAAPYRMQAALFGGDDYELCMTVAPQHCIDFEAAAAATSTVVTCIGEIVDCEITNGREIYCFDGDGQRLNFDSVAFQHFRRRARAS
jgi:thiamine-monophosphate kinase